MISTILWKAGRLSRRLWVKASLYGVVGISTALAAIVIGPWLPEGLPRSVGSNAVDAILQIIASSMLAVTTFSLSTLVSATATAAGSATPRATQLLLEDPTAQRALSTFLGAFLFSLVSLIALNTELYGDGGRFVLFIATLVVVALIVITLLRWMDHLAGLGNMGETISRVERAAQEAMDGYRQAPLLGGVELGSVPEAAIAIYHDEIGYLQHLDVATLSTVAEEADAEIFVTRRAGSYCDPAVPIAFVGFSGGARPGENDLADNIRAAFTLGDRRSYEQDPRFGLIALSEISSRALSPGINDPGTAIDVLAALVRVFGKSHRTDAERDEGPVYPRVHIAALTEDDLVDAAFMPTSRDGAGMIEVAIRLQKSLAAVAGCGNPALAAAAERMAALAARRGMEALSFAPDRDRLEREVASIGSRKHFNGISALTP
ncbi:DUF2254 domain-containing protein [Aliirhizobium terrae]|uniref:DUF2254 domain-containing protein n=1 Tax=Terrirhizobium terrae TaxID=2926709 RepID=UPI002577B693|nr:DUF2254 domain-containing protein [Rhizobium sp. CC-CFT758]WJH39325.1 DUF2254 domain-containing protein [Rhizobium sp. CC-CFT758]